MTIKYTNQFILKLNYPELIIICMTKVEMCLKKHVFKIIIILNYIIKI